MTGNAATMADKARLLATGWYRWSQTASITAGRPFKTEASRQPDLLQRGGSFPQFLSATTP